MKRIALVLLAIAAFAVPATQARAAKAPKTPTLAQFTALQKQVKKLQTQVTKAEDELIVLANLALGFQLCQNAATADALQGTWQAIDLLATALGRPAIFGPQTPISDATSCGLLRITRSQAVPPNTAVFSALAALLTPSAR